MAHGLPHFRSPHKSYIVPKIIGFEASIRLPSEIRVTNEYNNLPQLSATRKINREKSIAALTPMILIATFTVISFSNDAFFFWSQISNCFVN